MYQALLQDVDYLFPAPDILLHVIVLVSVVFNLCLNRGGSPHYEHEQHGQCYGQYVVVLDPHVDNWRTGLKCVRHNPK